MAPGGNTRGKISKQKIPFTEGQSQFEQVCMCFKSIEILILGQNMTLITVWQYYY